MVTPETPAGTGRDAENAVPAGTTDDERAAQREEWGRMQASYRRGNRNRKWRRRAARGTLPPPRAGMIRKSPPDGGDDAA